MIDHNPYLRRHRSRRREDAEASAVAPIEPPDVQDNIIWQTRAAAPSEYEQALCDALEALFLAGVDDIMGIVAGLNSKGLRTVNGELWTETLFKSEIKRLGE